MDHHLVASISIAGSCLDVLGTLYFAYDLLGGQHGPLRLLTRAVTYSILFGLGYGLGLGWIFGVASGLAIGMTFAIEINWTSKRQDHILLPWEHSSAQSPRLLSVRRFILKVGLRFAALYGVQPVRGILRR